MIPTPVGSLRDPFGRRIDYLRISVTEQCHFRCVYCVPPEGLPCPSHRELTPSEIERIGRVAVALGFQKIRLTGGEPLVRRDLGEIMHRLHSLSPRPKLVLTTNGHKLAENLSEFVNAGLSGVNVSVDSLDPQRFAEITRRDVLGQVLAGLTAALDAGLAVKVNAVVMRGIAPAEVFQFVELARTHDLEMRFLEFMPLCGSAWSDERHMPLHEIRRWIDEEYGLEREALAPVDNGQPATVYRLKQGRGKIGFIASLSEPFCDSCSRLRIAANGTIRPCLFSDMAFDLKPALQHADDAQLRDMFELAVLRKPQGHHWAAQSKAVQGSADDFIPQRPAPAYPYIHNIGG